MARRTDLMQDLLHGFNLVVPARTRCIDHVDEEICLGHLFQGRLEGRDETVRKLAYEAHRIGDEREISAVEIDAPGGRI